MAKLKWTKEKIIEYIEENTDYTFVDIIKYKGVNSRIVLLCNIHKEKFDINFNKLKGGNTCPICTREKRRKSISKWSIESIVSYVENHSKYSIINIHKYCGRRTKLEVLCENNHRRIITFETILSGCGCKICNDTNKINNNLNVIKSKMKQRNINNVELVDILYYNGTEDSSLLLKCSVCGAIFGSTYSNLMYTPHKNFCRRCANKHLSKIKSFDIDYIRKYIESYGYQLLSDIYKNNTTSILLKCNMNHIYASTFGAFKSGNRCPICNQSKGEKMVLYVLNKYKIKYTTQKRFEDCRSIHPLPFDFYLCNSNILIEYDGEFHYRISRYKDGLERFIGIKIRDTIKNEYCKNNNIKLIRIPYWEFDNIEKILCRELNLNLKLRRKGNKQLK